MALITITEYARRHGRSHSSMLQKIYRGGFKTAVKVGRDWLIDENEELVDNRMTSGEYVGWREKYPSPRRKGR